MTPRLRVLVVPKWYPWPELPVFGIFCREHARALALLNEVVVLASLATPSPDFALFRITDESEDGIRTLRVRYRRPRVRALALVCQLLGMFAALWRLRGEGFRPDVVHAHVYSAGLPALLIGRVSGAAVVVTEHYTGFQRGLITGYDRLVAWLAFTGADLVAPVSADLAGHVKAIAPRARIRVMPNVVDTATFFPAPRPRGGNIRLLNVAGLADKKGQAHLLQALATLRPGHPDMSLDIVGDGELRDSLEARAGRLGLADTVRFHGERSREDVSQLMREADLFVLPSLYENLPCVLIEAMASGLPSVASGVGGVPELLPFEAGVTVPPADPHALAQAIERALQRDFDSGEIAAHARERFSYETVGEEWTSIYLELGRRAGRTSSAIRRRNASSR